MRMLTTTTVHGGFETVSAFPGLVIEEEDKNQSHFVKNGPTSQDPRTRANVLFSTALASSRKYFQTLLKNWGSQRPGNVPRRFSQRFTNKAEPRTKTFPHVLVVRWAGFFDWICRGQPEDFRTVEKSATGLKSFSVELRTKIYVEAPNRSLRPLGSSSSQQRRPLELIPHLFCPEQVVCSGRYSDSLPDKQVILVVGNKFQCPSMVGV